MIINFILDNWLGHNTNQLQKTVADYMSQQNKEKGLIQSYLTKLNTIRTGCNLKDGIYKLQ